MSASLRDEVSWAATRRRLLERTAAGRLVRDYGSRDLIDYLRDAVVPRAPMADNCSAAALIAVLQERASGILGERHAERALLEFTHRPMIQLADGADTLLDIETLINHLMFQVVCRENNLQYMFTQQCTTVRAITSKSALRGPAFLDRHDDRFMVLSGSRRLLVDASVACLGRTQFLFSPLGKKTSLFANLECPDLVTPFREKEYERAVDGVLEINRWIWSRLRVKAKKELILFGEDLSADVVGQHLSHDTSPVSRILLDSTTRRAYLDARDEACRHYDNFVLRSTTDFFWARDGVALRPCRLQEGTPDVLVYRSGSKFEGIPLTKRELHERLRRHELFPDLALAYIVLSLLPGVFAVGGASQHEYLPWIQKILLATHEKAPILRSEDLDRLGRTQYSRMLGPSLLELNPIQKNALLALNERTSLDEFEAAAFNDKIANTAGSLQYLHYLDHLDKKRRGQR